MDRADQRLASAFGAAATAYAKHRPDYSQAAVRWSLESAPGMRVLDLGAGTGKLTATLVAVGADVIAVEPDPAMLNELRRALPDVHALPGSAEAIPLPDASVDAVLAGNALHWFDMAVAGPEIAGVLAPGGVLAGLWNVMDDRLDWVAELARVSGPAAIGSRDTRASWRAATARAHLPRNGESPRFGSPEQAEFSHAQRCTADSLVATLATRAGILVMPQPERQSTLDRIRAFLAARPETAAEFTLPLLTCVLRVRPLDQILPAGITVLRAERPPPDEMAAVHEASAVVAYAHIFDSPFPRADAHQKWASHTGEVWLARRGQALVGFATANGPELDGLFVLPGEQGRGIGAALLATVPAVTRLWVLEDAGQTRRWYEKRGWRATNDRRKAFEVWEVQYTRKAPLGRQLSE